MSHESTVPARRLALLSGLSDDEIRVVSRFLIRRPLAAGEVLCMEGDTSTSAFIPVHGRLEILTSSCRRPLGTVEPGEVFGLGSLLTDGAESVCCRAATDTILLELRRSDFEQIAAAPGTLGLRIVHQVLRHLARQLRSIDEVLDQWDVPPPPVEVPARRQARPAAPEPVVAPEAPEVEPPQARPSRKRGKRAVTDTDEQLLDRIREYSQKAGLGDLDNIRVARSGDQKIRPAGYDPIRRR